MASKNPLTLTIVIPAYNEQDHIEACLDSIAAQTKQPDNVILVDNNSTDKTVEIAKKFPRVKVIAEKRQGVLYARDAGFDAVTTDLIGRIDADSRLEPDWVEKATQYLTANPGASAVTGDCFFYDFPFKKPFQILHHFSYYTMQRLISGSHILWGSNMAIKREVWHAVRGELSSSKAVHEDIDLSLVMARRGYRIDRSHGLVAHVSLRRGDLGPLGIINYLLPWPRTYLENKRYLQAVGISLFLLLIWVLVIPLSLFLWTTRKIIG